MTWEVQADVVIDAGQRMALIRSLDDFFAQHVEYVYFDVTRGDWPVERIHEQEFYGPTRLDEVERMIESMWAPDRTVRIGLALQDAGTMDYAPQAEVYLLGEKVQEKDNHTRRSAPAVLMFGNRKAWRGTNTLPTGLKLDEATLVRAMRHVCTTVRPASLYLINEECVSIPFNDHFVFHAAISGYARDLEDILQLCLYGGQGRYKDARGRYRPALTTWPTMLFCKRPADWLDALRRFLAGKLPRLEKRGIPHELPLAMAEDAALKSGDLEFFFTDDGGLGIYVEKLFTSYVEGFYLALIDEILGETDQDGPLATR